MIIIIYFDYKTTDSSKYLTETMAHLRPDMCNSLTDDIIEALNRINVWTVNDLLSVKDLMELKQESGIKFHTLKQIHDTLKQNYSLTCFDLNYVLEKSLEICIMCPTGIPLLTTALEGGFQSQEIVEFFGDTECGKTEMCHLICAEFLLHFDDYNILYIDPTHSIDTDKLNKFLKFKAHNRILGDEDILNCLSRIHVARPIKLSDLVHLLNTSIHSDRRNKTKCIIIDTLSLIIQDDILEIKTSNLDDGDVLEKFAALKTPAFNNSDKWTNVNSERKYLVDVYLHEVMKLLTQITLTKNVILIITNSDQTLAYSRSWTNSIDHRIQLKKMPDFSRYTINNPRSTVIEATIIKTLHNITKIGHSIPFVINDEGIIALQAKETVQQESQSGSSETSQK